MRVPFSTKIFLLQVCALSRRDPALLDATPLSPDDELALYGLGGSSLTSSRRGALVARTSAAIGAAGLSYEEVLRDDFQFDMQAHDVMVFLHIQKTGGTSFGRHLVRDLDLQVGCNVILYNVYVFFFQRNS